MLSMGIVMLLAVWRSHVMGELPASWETMFGLVGAIITVVGFMMYLSVLIAWWERWLLRRRTILSLAGSIPLVQGDES